MAHSIKKWITNEVLPSIRKTGYYSTQPTKPVHDPINPFGFKNEDEMEFVFNILILKKIMIFLHLLVLENCLNSFQKGKKQGIKKEHLI